MSEAVSEVITIRVSKELKDLIEEAGMKSSDIREYIEARAKSLRLKKLMKKVYKDADRIRVKGDSTRLVRWGRDSR